jgi:hypothetical protein
MKPTNLNRFGISVFNAFASAIAFASVPKIRARVRFVLSLKLKYFS